MSYVDKNILGPLVHMHVLVILFMYLDYRKQTLRKKKVNACHCALTSMVLYDLTGV